jgi:hypothetical protein
MMITFAWYFLPKNKNAQFAVTAMLLLYLEKEKEVREERKSRAESMPLSLFLAL